MEKRILFLEGNQKVDFGGAQRVALEILESLKDDYVIFGIETGHSPTFFKTARNYFVDSLQLKIFGNLKTSLSVKEILYNSIFLPLNLLSISIFLLRKDLGRKNTIVYTNSRYGHLIAFFMGICGFKVVGHIHNVENEGGLKGIILRFLYLSFSRLIFVSHTSKANSHSIPSLVLYNPVKSSSIKEKQYTKDNSVKVGFVSSLHEPKGVLWAVKAIEGYNNVEIHIAGQGPEEEELLKTKSKLHGFVEEMDHFYENYCDIIIVPTLISEAFGLVAVEALSRGIPVIATSWGGQREVVSKFLGPEFLFSDVEELKNLILKFENNPDFFYEKAMKARVKVQECLNKDKFKKQLINFVQEV